MIPQIHHASEKTLLDVLREIWRARFYMMFFGLCLLLLAFIFNSLARPYYRAEMIIFPVIPMQEANAFTNYDETRHYSQDSTLNFPEFLRFENTFSGPTVARLLLQDENIRTGLNYDRPFKFSKGKSNWSSEELSQYLRRYVDNEPVGGTSMRKLIYMHPNRDFSSYLLKRLHRATDELIRSAVRVETQDRIAYLQDAIAKTAHPDHRRALTDLLMEQERMKMLVSIDQPYSARVIEPASTDIKPRWPDKFLLFPGFVLMGLFIGFIVHGLRNDA